MNTEASSHLLTRLAALLPILLLCALACSAKSDEASAGRGGTETLEAGTPSQSTEEGGVATDSPRVEAGTALGSQPDASAPRGDSGADVMETFIDPTPDASFLGDPPAESQQQGPKADASAATPSATTMPPPDPTATMQPPTPTATMPTTMPDQVLMPPESWNCVERVYGDGTCDCGCGAPDPDCEGRTDTEVCTRCGLLGSCNQGGCPGLLDLEDNAVCRELPETWSCIPQLYGEGGDCHCGCGAPDPDCESSSIDACDVCDSNGGCAGGACPSAIDEEDNAHCSVPEGWSCPVDAYADGVCHCGCALLDPDCDGYGVEECGNCWEGCSVESCPGPIDAADNTICTGVPAAWDCEPRFFGDGVLCHCGCGAPDVDCDTNELAACDACNFEGSCSLRDCPGTIDPMDIAHCYRPDPPPEWTCHSSYYADGFRCDCGCGALDLDCVDEELETCDACFCAAYYYYEGACTNRIDPEDPTQCIPPPEDWTCSDYNYSDGYSCDCGCGVPDPDCDGSTTGEVCNYCPPGSCSEYNCEDISPEDNTVCTGGAPPEWTCDAGFYGDGACDCECGATDLDCEQDPTCVFCGGAPCEASE